jgi:hypothetical protein
MKTRLGIAVLSALALAVPATGLGSEIEVYSNTQLNAQNLWRNGQGVSTVPLYEFLTLTGRDVEIPGGQISFSVDGWGGVDLSSPPWWNGYNNFQLSAQSASLAGNSGRWSGDLNLAWVRGAFLGNDLRITVGRQSVGTGNARMLQLDGLAVGATIANMITVDAYVGAPTVQRFIGWGSVFSANPTLGNLATGGRVGFTWANWVNVGVSGTFAWDSGTVTREELAVDLKVSPVSWMYFMGYLDWSLYAYDYSQSWGRTVADANASLVFPVSPYLQFTAEYVYTVPSLFLPYTSILWVFSDSTNQWLGASARVGLELFHVPVPIDFDVGYRHVFLESWEQNPGTPPPYTVSNGAASGNKMYLRGTWRPNRNATVGAEGSFLDSPDGEGYWNARAFGSLKMWGFLGTLDFQGYWFKEPVNSFSSSLVGAATLGYDFGHGLSVTGAVQAGQTPYYQSFVSGLVKLTYNASYSFREVR